MVCKECGRVPLVPTEFHVLIQARGECGVVLAEQYDESLQYCSETCAVTSARTSIGQGSFLVEGAEEYTVQVGGGGILHELLGVIT